MKKVVAVFTSSDEVLVFPLGPNGPEGKDDFSDRNWEEYDEEIGELPLRIEVSSRVDISLERSLS